MPDSGQQSPILVTQQMGLPGASLWIAGLGTAKVSTVRKFTQRSRILEAGEHYACPACLLAAKLIAAISICEDIVKQPVLLLGRTMADFRKIESQRRQTPLSGFTTDSLRSAVLPMSRTGFLTLS